MNTRENNKLLAEFLGMKIITFKGIEYVENAGNLTANLADDLEAFTYDWNWLMQVVEKIESLGGVITIGNVICFIESKYTEDSIRMREATKIEAVYKACTEFVKWYNENRAKEN